MILGVIGFAYRYPQLNIKMDISYELYLYHMIAINAMVFMGFYDSGYVCILVALIISIAMAIMSYFTLGALSRKSKNKRVKPTVEVVV